MEVKSICIVGGGSSGWMMATALVKKLPNIKVTLVESPEVKTIGVGESTIPYFTAFIEKYLGFKEEEWMPFCSATYKASIRFNNFRNSSSAIYHPFLSEEESQYNGYDWAVKKKLSPDTPIEDYYSSYYSAYHMCKNNTFSKDTNIHYAHHIDAAKFGEFCKLQCPSVLHIQDTVTEVVMEDSLISKLKLKGSPEVSADLFIDCTGFTALLIGKAYNQTFVSSKNTLLNDTAVVCRVPYTDNKLEEMQPYTDCTALSAGWAWNTPLWDRVGTGYVYSSKFITQEDAQIEFKNYLADRYSEERIKGLEYSHIPFKAGRYKKAWVGNCASLVLSSGFIEPLESTGLALTAFQIGTLISSLVGGNSFTNLSRYRFNLEVDTAMSEVHEFVLVHYVNTNRDDSPYWKYISNTLDIPSTIGRERKHQSFWFPLKSWECIELGFEISGIFTDSLAHNKHKLEDEDFDKATALCNVNNTLRGLKGHTKSSTESFNSHYQYLKERVYAKR